MFSLDTSALSKKKNSHVVPEPFSSILALLFNTRSLSPMTLNRRGGSAVGAKIFMLESCENPGAQRGISAAENMWTRTMPLQATTGR